MPSNGYFDTAFALNGTLTTIPDPTQANGTVLYNQGFPASYSTPVASGGYNFPRAQFNQLMNDITSAIQFMQQNGASNFITTAMNGGEPYSYNIGAVVMYNAGSGIQAWISTASSNTTTPGAVGATWNALTTGSGRLRLTADTTFYVATTGNNTNPGTSSEPWLTMQYAYNYIASNIDIAGFNCAISVADGTYASGLLATIPTVGGTVSLQGNISTPSNCVISAGGSPCIAAMNGLTLNVAGGFEVTGSSYLVMARGSGANVTIFGAMNYGLASGGSGIAQINAFWGGFVEVEASYTISGNSGNHIYTSGGTIRITGITVTLTGTPSFSGSYALGSDTGRMELFANTYSGAATGVAYLAQFNSVINTNGAGLPSGLSAGSEFTGGQYA